MTEHEYEFAKPESPTVYCRCDEPRPDPEFSGGEDRHAICLKCDKEIMKKSEKIQYKSEKGGDSE